MNTVSSAQPAVLTPDGLQALIDDLRRRGYRVIGPRLRDQAIIYNDIAFVGDMPRGWTDEQDGGRNLTHPRWDNVAERCLSCGNCTMVCPTCSCTSVEDSSDLTGQESSRTQRWDSCFTMDFSYPHGGSARSWCRGARGVARSVDMLSGEQLPRIC